MKISLNWLNELLTIKEDELNFLIERLTLGGFEVEEVLEYELDGQTCITLDIAATANRSDSLSIQGISTEISALLDKSYNSTNFLLKSDNLRQIIFDNAQTLLNTNECNFLSAVSVENINLETTIIPDWLQKKLLKSGITPLNNIMDFQNYVLLETGYTFAIYDFDKISKKLKTWQFKLTIENATNGEIVTGTNSISYTLDNSILVVRANSTSIGIAGIIESEEFECSKASTKLLVEGSIFDASKIRQQSRKIGLRTDRSARYEKSIKNTYLIQALFRFISLLRISNPNLNLQFHTIAKRFEPKTSRIQLNYKTICKILGPIKNSQNTTLKYIARTQVEKSLLCLNFKVNYNQVADLWEVEIPHSRTEDIKREIDLIEEIGRLYGFNNFLTILPKLRTIGNKDESYKLRQKITTCLLSLGFNEIINYSLVKDKTVLNNQIKLINPLISDYSNLRTSLLPDLLQVLQQNLKQGNKTMDTFEYGHVFLQDNISIFKEKEYIAGLFGGFKARSTWLEPEKATTWFEAKDDLEQLFQQLNINPNWEISIDIRYAKICHPYRTAELFISNRKKLGVFGQIHPILANQLKLPFDIYLFECDLDVIKTQIKTNNLTILKDYSLYPKIIKNVSFIVEKDISFQQLRSLIYSNGTQFLSEINLLDEYNNLSISEDTKSLCLQLVFQSKETTLQNKKIEQIVKNIQIALINEFNIIMRH